MMLASSSATAKRSPATCAGVGAQALGHPSRVGEVAEAAPPGEDRVENPNIAAAPTTTSAIPIHRSTRSYFINLGVMRLSMM